MNRSSVAAWIFLVLGFLAGHFSARNEARREVRQCFAAESEEDAQFACPEWLRRLR